MSASSCSYILAITLLVASCRTPGSDPSAGLPGGKVAGGEVPSNPQPYPIPSSAGSRELVEAALRHHPGLGATRARITALEQSAVQARALPDPSASLTTGSMAETAAGQMKATAAVQQKIPAPGKRNAQALIALRQADAMRAQLRLDELALSERVRIAYWNYYGARRSAEVVTEARNPLLSLRGSVEARVAANQASQQDLLRLENELAKLDQHLVTARGRSEAARASLNALLYRPGGSPLPLPREEGLGRHGSAASLLARARTGHPEVAAAEARIAAAEQGVELAKLRTRPDLMAGIAYSPVSDEGIAPSATGKDQFMGTLGVTLPIWKDKNEAARGEAAAKLSAARSTLAATRASLQQRIESAAATYEAEQASLALYSERLLPDAQQSFDLAVAEYTAEAASFLDVIDAWRQLLTYKLAREENRARVGIAEADLRHAAGLP